MTRAATPRRRERPRRLLAALGLLLVSTAGVLAGLFIGTVGALTAAALASVLAGWVAAHLGHEELVEERHHHAEERVAQARAFRSLYLERSAEHALFASRMRDRVLASDRLADELRGILRLAEARGDEAEARVRSERRRASAAEARVAELEVQLAGTHSELIDELAAWEIVPGVDGDTVVDLLSWEERATAAKVGEQRKRA
jgi:hypothetical protein